MVSSDYVIKLRAKINTQWIVWLNVNISPPIRTDNTVRTVREDGKLHLGHNGIMFQNRLIITYHGVIGHKSRTFIVFGTKLVSIQFMFWLCLTPWSSFIPITQRLWNAASSFSFLISPDDSSHSSSCLFGYCSTWLAGPEMSAPGLYKDMFGN